MRRFIFEWGPDGIEDGLVSALERHGSSLNGDGPSVEVDGPPGPLPLTRTVETHLFGISREALANAAKHARASSAEVRVEATNHTVTVEIEDNGCGFDPDAAHTGHYGLDSMRSRAEEIGAAFSITSIVGHGTLVRVEVPVDGSRNGR
jgi:signal transduction histidine kinase